jgi:hypothetical protein
MWVMDRHSFLLFCVCIFNKVMERFENDEGFTGVSYRFTDYGLQWCSLGSIYSEGKIGQALVVWLSNNTSLC